MKEPELKTSRQGKEYYKLSVLVDPGTGNGTQAWWNVTLMKDVYDLLPSGLIEKFRYAKFIGLGTPMREYTKADGTKGFNNDLLVSGVEMQNGDLIRPERKSRDEEAF